MPGHPPVGIGSRKPRLSDLDGKDPRTLIVVLCLYIGAIALGFLLSLTY